MKFTCWMILTYFNRFAIKYPNKNTMFQKFHFLLKAVFNSLWIQNGVELVFESIFCRGFLIIFLLQYYLNWPNFTRLCLLLKLFSKIYFFVLCLGIWWRHEIDHPETLKFEWLGDKKRFWSEIKIIFLSFKSALF